MIQLQETLRSFQNELNHPLHSDNLDGIGNPELDRGGASELGNEAAHPEETSSVLDNKEVISPQNGSPMFKSRRDLRKEGDAELRKAGAPAAPKG